MSPKPKTVLIVDDDEGMRDTLTAILKREYLVLTAATGEEGLSVLKREDVDLILLDIRLPGINGLEMLTIVKENYSLVEVIMVSALNEVEVAVTAMKQGAYHYITKEFDYDGLRSLVRNALERQDLSRQLISLHAQVAEQGDREFVLGPSRAMREIVDLAQKVARLPATVLIQGESGTGKELLARLLHRESGRGDAPFIAVNLAAVPRDLVESNLFGHERGAFTGAMRQQLGKFELAAGGTLFLDEIADLGLDLQAKLLRAIQEGEIERVGGTKPIKTEFRLVVATNIDLDRAVKDGKFRDDLYYRINVIPFKMPPLRERVEDIPGFVTLFLERYNTRFRKQISGISDSALRILQDPDGPTVAGQHPRAREPDRASGRGDRQDHADRGGSAVRVSPRPSRPPSGGQDRTAAGRMRHVRAQLHPPSAREDRVERVGRSALPGCAAQHAEAQDGPARGQGARQAVPADLRARARITTHFRPPIHPAGRRQPPPGPFITGLWPGLAEALAKADCSWVTHSQFASSSRPSRGPRQGICVAYFSDRTQGRGVLVSANKST